MLKLFKSKIFIRQFLSYILLISITFLTVSYVFVRETTKFLDRKEISIVIEDLSFMIVLVVFISIFFAFILSKAIVEPINRLIKSTDDIIYQSYKRPINIKSNSELDFLINRFNNMQCIIKDREVELKEKNEALKGQMAEVLELSGLKSEFLANMSHELRTPLNSIIGFTTRVIKKTENIIPDVQLENLKIVKDQAYHLLQMINSVLDYSKLEAGKMEVYKENFNLTEVINEVGSMIKVLLEGKPIKYIENITCTESNIYSDRLKVKQILINLLSNAAKYSEKGNITLSLDKNEEGYLITIEDEGIGIAGENLESIFEEFRQIDGSYTRKVGGTGLGLSITKRLLEMLRGNIMVKSNIGLGSVFTIFLPIGHYVADIKEEEEKSYIKRIVVVDDDFNVQRLYKQYLNEHGFQVIALDGKGQVTEEIAKVMPDLVLLDIMLPNKDGWQILSEVKHHPHIKEIPVVMISVLNEKTLAYKLNADGFLVKPVTQEELLETIITVIYDKEKIIEIEQ